MTDAMPVIRPGDCEYIHWTATGLPPDVTTAEVSFDDGVTWHSATVTGTDISALIASPTAPPIAGAIVGSVGCTSPRVRFTDNPEIVSRQEGFIEIR